jgi:tetratricopeptide (TPR) repeat protein
LENSAFRRSVVKKNASAATVYRRAFIAAKESRRMNRETRESTDRKIPNPLGYALHLLLTGYGWTARDLAAAAVVNERVISACIREDSLTRERLDELASFMDLGPGDVSRALLAARLVLPAPPLPGSPVDPTPEDLRTHRQAAAMAAGEVFDLVQDELLRGARSENRRLALEEGRKAADRLKTYSRADQLVLVKGAPEYRQWSVARVLCADSEAAPHRSSRALELAELALLVAGNVQGVDDGLKTRLQGWCHGFAGNARSSLPAAEESFAEAWRLWYSGKDPAGLLSQARLFDMEASLRRAQGRLPQALELHDDALAAALPDEAGAILVNKAGTLQQGNKYEEALDVLALAAKRVDAERQPRLRFGILLNTASVLISLGPGRAQEIKGVAADVLSFFQVQKVDSEAVEAAILFQKAAEEERVTQELVRQLKASLARARPLPREEGAR